MSDEELGEVFDALAGEDGDLLFEGINGLGADAAESDARNLWEQFTSKVNVKYLDGIDPETLRIDDDGDLIAKINGEDVNMSQVKAGIDSPGAVTEDGEAFIDRSFKNLGFKIDTEEFQEFSERQIDAWRATDQGQIYTSIDDMEDAAKDVGSNDIKDPGSAEEFKKTMDEKYGDGTSDRIEKDFQEQKDAAKAKDEKKFEEASKKTWYQKAWYVSKIFLGIAGLMGLAAAAVTAYEYIKAVQDALSGCWLGGQGSNCKIFELTCSSADRGSQTRPWVTCNVCTNAGDCKANEWIPLPKKAKRCNPDTSTPFPGTYSSTGYTAITNPCTDKKANDNYACANASTCIVPENACGSGNQQNSDCSNYCNPNALVVPAGMTVQCRQVSFGGAVGNIFNKVLSEVWGGLDSILKYLLYIGAGILVLVVIFYLGKWAFHSASSSPEDAGDGGGGSGNTVHIKVSSE